MFLHLLRFSWSIITITNVFVYCFYPLRIYDFINKKIILIWWSPFECIRQEFFPNLSFNYPPIYRNSWYNDIYWMKVITANIKQVQVINKFYKYINYDISIRVSFIFFFFFISFSWFNHPRHNEPGHPGWLY